MPVLGMRGTGVFDTDERPKNYREAILYMEPNGDSPLTAVMSKLKNEVTTDYEFKHFQKDLPTQRTLCTAIEPDDETSIAVTATTASLFKKGHAVINERTLEIMWVNTDPSSPYNTLTVTRGKGGSAAVTAIGDGLLIVGSHYQEDAAMPSAISYSPTTITNYTQDFRTALDLTWRTKNTKVRTGNHYKELKRETNLLHGMEMEKAFIFGSKQEATSGDMADTTTGGLLEWCTTTTKDFNDAATIDDWEDWLELLFRYGSSEKLCLCGSTAMLIINRFARVHGHVLVDVGEKAYGMAIKKWITPFGDLFLKRHPLLSENPTFRDWGFCVDTKFLKYRYLTNSDTRFLKDVKKDGKHAERSEFASDCGLELQHEKVHGIFRNLSALAA